MRPRGFTLLEVMISVGILALVVVSVMATQTAALRLAGYHRDQTLAGELARAQLAEAVLIPVDELGPDGGAADGAYGRYRWERTLHRTRERALTRVRITVRWGPEGERDLVVETLVTPTETEL